MVICTKSFLGLFNVCVYHGQSSQNNVDVMQLIQPCRAIHKDSDEDRMVFPNERLVKLFFLIIYMYCFRKLLGSDLQQYQKF